MLKFKPFIVLAAILFAVTLLIPTMLVLPFMEEKAGGKLGEELQEEAKDVSAGPSADSAVEVAVYRTALSKTEKLPLDEYLIGVVAAEMPAEFELEALKALWKSVHLATGIPLETPLNQFGKTSTVSEQDFAYGKRKGFVSHYHVNKKKIDCAGLDIKTLLEELDR